MKKIVPSLVFWTFYMAAFVSLVLPIRAIEEDRPLWNHIFLLIWAVAAMVAAVFRSRQEKKDSQKIVGDAIVGGVVVYSGLALFLVVFGDYYSEMLEVRGSLLRISEWKVFVFALEGLLIAWGSRVVIWRTNGWSSEIDAANETGMKDCSQDIHECCCRTVGATISSSNGQEA